MAIEWTDDILVGIAPIDKQHKELVEKLIELNDVVYKGEVREKVIPIMEFLEEYVRTHFRLEEEYMVKYKYPGLWRHKRYHEYFMTRVAGMKKELEKEGSTRAFALRLQRELTAWFIDHICEEDKVAARYIIDKGIERV